MKTANLAGPALDWAVAKAEGISGEKVTWAKKPGKRFWWTDDRGVSCSLKLATRLFDMRRGGDYAPSTSWAQGGPIIDRERIDVCNLTKKEWFATSLRQPDRVWYGATFLIAAMRCYVASKLGDEVEMPKELK